MTFRINDCLGFMVLCVSAEIEIVSFGSNNKHVVAIQLKVRINRVLFIHNLLLFYPFIRQKTRDCLLWQSLNIFLCFSLINRLI